VIVIISTKMGGSPQFLAGRMPGRGLADVASQRDFQELLMLAPATKGRGENADMAVSDRDVVACLQLFGTCSSALTSVEWYHDARPLLLSVSLT
jgi:hypothetical protein